MVFALWKFDVQTNIEFYVFVHHRRGTDLKTPQNPLLQESVVL